MPKISPESNLPRLTVGREFTQARGRPFSPCAIDNRQKGRPARYSFSLAPSGITEIGIVEAGWSFKSGESLEIKVGLRRALHVSTLTGSAKCLVS